MRMECLNAPARGTQEPLYFTGIAAKVGDGAENKGTTLALIRVPMALIMALKYLEKYSGSRKRNAMNIVMAIREDKNRTIQQIADAAGVSKRTAARYIKEFQNAGILRREGSDISRVWILLSGLESMDAR